MEHREGAAHPAGPSRCRILVRHARRLARTDKYRIPLRTALLVVTAADPIGWMTRGDLLNLGDWLFAQ